MPRNKRIESPIECYHVTQRGVGKQILFEDKRDCIRYINKIQECKSTIDFEVIAYSLMNNHVHLLIRTAKIEDLSKLMRIIGTSYARYFNTKYDRSGYVFQDRFHSFPINDESQLFACISYIHNNPVKAGYCKVLEDYEWSSYQEYLDVLDKPLAEENNMMIADVRFLRGILDGKQHFIEINQTEDDYKKVVAESNDAIMARGQTIINNSLGYRYDNGLIVNQLSKPVRDKIIIELRNSGMTYKQIELLTGVSKTIQRRIQGRG